MSRRAYKITREEKPSFNCSYDDRIMSIAYDYQQDGNLIMEKEEAKDLLEEMEEELENDKDNKNLIRQIESAKQIIIDCGDEDSVNYSCY